MSTLCTLYFASSHIWGLKKKKKKKKRQNQTSTLFLPIFAQLQGQYYCLIALIVIVDCFAAKSGITLCALGLYMIVTVNIRYTQNNFQFRFLNDFICTFYKNTSFLIMCIRSYLHSFLLISLSHKSAYIIKCVC